MSGTEMINVNFIRSLATSYPFRWVPLFGGCIFNLKGIEFYGKMCKYLEYTCFIFSFMAKFLLILCHRCISIWWLAVTTVYIFILQIIMSLVFFLLNMLCHFPQVCTSSTWIMVSILCIRMASLFSPIYSVLLVIFKVNFVLFSFSLLWEK